MARQAIEQAECSCDTEDAEFRVTDKDSPDDREAIVYDVRCECGEEGKVVIGSDGIAASDFISYENASWNQSEDDEDDSEE